MKDNPDLANEIEKKIKESLGMGPRVDAPADTPTPSAIVPAVSETLAPATTSRASKASSKTASVDTADSEPVSVPQPIDA